MEYGRAVLLARTALGINDTIPYTRVHECEIMNLPTSERRGDENQATEQSPESPALYSAYVNPNPAKDHLSISVSDFEEANWRIELFSSLGQKVTEHYLQLGNNQLDVTVFRSGIYYWRIFRSNVQVVSDKLIITK
jgi:hypothetical protein